MRFHHPEPVPAKGRGVPCRQVLQGGLHGDDLLGHVGRDHAEQAVVPLRHRLHQLVAIAARGAHYERQAVLDVQLGVGVDGGGVRVVDRDQIQIADGRPDAGDARFDLGNVGRGHELDGGAFWLTGSLTVIWHGSMSDPSWPPGSAGGPCAGRPRRRPSPSDRASR